MPKNPKIKPKAMKCIKHACACRKSYLKFKRPEDNPCRKCRYSMSANTDMPPNETDCCMFEMDPDKW